MIDCKKFVENSRKWLKEYIQNNHLQSCVLGVSGGLDSCISACLASPVCQELNIPLIGRSLPSKTNTTNETKVANLVGNAFCTDYKEVEIDCSDLIHELEMCEGKMTALQKGNVKARYRMIYLYNLASIHKGIVLDNDNFTEWNLGFYTIHGDSPCDVNLGLHYLWKNEVYELADYLENYYYTTGMKYKENHKEYYGFYLDKADAIFASMNLIPTDGNGVSNSDYEQFGLDNYEQVDDVLKTMYYGKTNIKNHPELLEAYNDLSKAGVHPEYIRLIDSYNEQGVDKVMLLHQNTAFKRRELPIKPTKKELGL